MARSTLSRWFHWLTNHFSEHRRVLCSKVATLGYYSTCVPFWLHWLDANVFSRAMVLLHQEGVTVP
jgi:hypothetical protein